MLTEKVDGRKIFSATAKPIIMAFDETYYDLDPVLKQLRHVMIKDTANNREYGFWNDSISQSMTEITSAVLIGNGIKFHSKNTKALKLIEDFNSEINVQGRTIEDYMRSVWFDEIIHANSFWRIAIDRKKYKFGIDIQRIDPKTITKKRDPKEGWTALIQTVPDYKSYRTKLQFYKNVVKDDYIELSLFRNKDIMIPDEPTALLRTSFFIRAPIAAALHFIAHKRWTIHFMRKFAQKHWAPFLIALVGDPKTNFYPDTPEKMEEEMELVAKYLPKITNWGGIALPGNTKVEVLDTSSAKSSTIYKDAIELLDKQIMYTIFASMAMRDASGSELSTQRGILQGYYTFLEGIRRKYARTLIKFYVKCLLPINGIEGVTEKDIKAEFSTLTKTGYLEISQAIERLNIAGVFKDDNEVRKAASTVFKWLKDLPEGQNKKRKYYPPNMPTMGGGLGSSKPSGSNTPKNPQKKRASPKSKSLEEKFLSHASEENGKNIA